MQANNTNSEARMNTGQRIFSVGAAWITKCITNQRYPLTHEYKLSSIEKCLPYNNKYYFRADASSCAALK